jgi:16S rRNA (cytosine967-C5)-methyltransferase
VLRNVVRCREELREPEDPFLDTPAWLAARWRKTYGEATAIALAETHRLEPTLDLSVKSDAAAWAERLDGIVLPTDSVRLSTRTAIADLDGYGDGAWWVQDAAASLPARLLNVRAGERVADLCAAPGGKTAQLAHAGAQVVALDRSAERMKRLATNMARLDLTVTVSIGDVLNFDGGPYDAILLDAPCTATGTIRRHPDVAWTKRASDISTLATTQARMIDRALTLLKSGGRLVYCTCSLEPEEGELQIAALLRRNPDVVRVPIKPDEIGGMPECINEHGDLRTLPIHLWTDDPRLSGLDGFFAARLERR